MATKTKENLKLIKALQSAVFNSKIDEKVLTSIGIDLKIKQQEFRNIKITYDGWNGLNVSVIDNQKDLDGLPINENKKLITRVKNLLENGTKKINISDLNELNIWKPSKEITIGNIKLKNNSDFLFTYDYYDIKLIDENKNIDGLWLDNKINTNTILDVLKHYHISGKKLANMSELDLNKELENLFKLHFETVKKGGRSNQGDIDLIIGSHHNYGIELKLARELLKASNFQKAIGQIEMYTRQFKGNFMLIVAGKTTEKNDKAISEVVRKAKDCNCTYYYIDAD